MTPGRQSEDSDASSAAVDCAFTRAFHDGLQDAQYRIQNCYQDRIVFLPTSFGL